MLLSSMQEHVALQHGGLFVRGKRDAVSDPVRKMIKAHSNKAVFRFRARGLRMAAFEAQLVRKCK